MTNLHPWTRILVPSRCLLALCATLLAGCGARVAPTADNNGDSAHRLPTGAMLDPAGTTSDVGPYPFTMIPAPERDRVVLLLAGYGLNGVQVVQTTTGKVLQTLPQPAAFMGLAFDAEGRNLYASGGNRDLVYRYAWKDGAATLADSIVIGSLAPRQNGKRYPAGLALSRDGRFLYVVENLDDSLAVVELTSGKVVQRLAAGLYPSGVVVSPDGKVFVSSWGRYEVRAFRRAGDRLEAVASIRVARHPSTMLLNEDGSRLFVTSASTDRITVVDTRAGQMIAELVDTVPHGAAEGSTPIALQLSENGRRLFVAEGDNNAVAVFDLSGTTAGKSGLEGFDRLAGRIPVGWYPAGLVVRDSTLIVANAKGRGTAPNGTNGPGPGRRNDGGYTLSQLSGTLSVLRLTGLDLAPLSKRVALANGWDRALGRPAYPAFEHVIYIIKENRTYDQVFGDMAQGDGDTSLVFFGRESSPNHHALAERFGLFDRFFVNAEVSADGHNWTTAAYTNDYIQKTVPLSYGGKGRTSDYEGTNRGKRPADGEDVSEGANGYLWDLAKKRGITFRNFGEFVGDPDDNGPVKHGYVGLKPFLDAHTDSTYPGWNLNILDQRRADAWLNALAGWQRSGSMPALQILRLPNDHTNGATAGRLTPRAYFADNDLALGRIIAGLTASTFWKNTIVFVLEDDAQNGPDHVDSHRSPMLVISPYNTTHTWHRFTNTTDVLATIEEILSLDHLSQFDKLGRPLRGIFETQPDLKPYTALTPTIPLTERNVAGGPGARESARLDFSREDLADDAAFNHVLWEAIKGPDRPYPGTHALTSSVLRPH